MSIAKNTQIHDLLIIGAGGYGREVAWLAGEIYGDKLRIIFAVERRFLTESMVGDIPCLALESLPSSSSQASFVVAIGNHIERRRIAFDCESKNLRPVSLIHPRTEHSPQIKIGEGSIVSAGTILTTNVNVGRHTHINIGCTVGHDVKIGDFTTISPGVHISGNVHIEDDVFIGTGANIINGAPDNPLLIGKGAVVAAGACVIGNVHEYTMVAGIPATTKKNLPRK